jgi:hypothetical protein
VWSAETKTNRVSSGAVLLTVALWSGRLLVAQSEHVTYYKGVNDTALGYTSD